MKTQYNKLSEVQVEVSNIQDATSVYNIVADIRVNENRVTSISNGRVIKDDVHIATFSCYGQNSPTYSFNNIPYEEHCNILNEIIEFIKSANNLVETNPITI
jgi:hypothetical protein